MSRVNRMQMTNSNPATRFYEWKSDHQKFGYWDKEAGEKGEFVFDELPFKFLALTSYKLVSGFNPKYRGGGSKGTGVRSNEVKDLKDRIKVYYMDPDRSVIAEGNWQEIKEKVEAAQGKFTLSIYGMNPEGQLINLKLSGASVGAWFDFSKNKSNMFFDHWIEVKSFKTGKVGSVEFNYPIFGFGGKLSKKDESFAEECDNKMETYESYYFGSSGGSNFDNPTDSAVEAYNQRQPVMADDADLDF